jgi:hypothetical protein
MTQRGLLSTLDGLAPAQVRGQVVKAFAEPPNWVEPSQPPEPI